MEKGLAPLALRQARYHSVSSRTGVEVFERPVPYHRENDGQRRFFLDPTQPISIDFCTECWTFLPESSCICAICGRSSGHFEVYGAKECRLCGQRIDKREAKEYPPSGFTPLSGSYECFDCLNKIERTKKAFEAVVSSEKCKRHRDVRATYSCEECGERLCRFCTYYLVKGLFRKEFIDRPLCFFCVRRELDRGSSAAVLHIYRNLVAKRGYRFQR